MRTKRISLIVLTLILTTGIAFCVESQPDDNRPVIGIILDTTPLPELLIKHLGLKSGQGIRISNIKKGSSAEEQGLDRDDIVIAIQGKDLFDRKTLTNTVRQAGVGAEISMEVIHLGQRKTINLKLKPSNNATGWKYQDEPQIEKSFLPGRIYRIGPGDEGWTQILGEQIPDDIKSSINTVFNEMYSSTSFIDGKMYSVTIKGSPKDNDSKITVKIDNDKYETTIGKLDELPSEYQEAAKNAIEKAKQKETTQIPMFFDDTGGNIMPRLNLDSPSINTPNTSSNPFFQRMEEQMRLMQGRFRELEQSHQKLLEHLNENQQ
ncbi:MAG: PDZ domain-containing protein [Sedimentisphaerales bacterium]|nr:PDZ domain-containing protein [Sedimentisphaerales bacterium]